MAWKRPQPQQGPGHLGVVPDSDKGDGSHPPAPAHAGPMGLCQTAGTQVRSPFPCLGWQPEAWNASPPPAAAFPAPPSQCFLYLPKDAPPRLSLSPSLCDKALPPPSVAQGHAAGQGFADSGSLGPSWLSGLCQTCSTALSKGKHPAAPAFNTCC